MIVSIEKKQEKVQTHDMVIFFFLRLLSLTSHPDLAVTDKSLGKRLLHEHDRIWTVDSVHDDNIVTRFQDVIEKTISIGDTFSGGWICVDFEGASDDDLDVILSCRFLELVGEEERVRGFEVSNDGYVSPALELDIVDE